MKEEKIELHFKKAFEVLYGEILSMWLTDDEGNDYLGFLGLDGYVIMEVDEESLIEYRTGGISMCGLFNTEMVLDSFVENGKSVLPVYVGDFSESESNIVIARPCNMDWDMFNDVFYEGTLTFENPNPETLEDIYGKDWDSEEEDFDWRGMI